MGRARHRGGGGQARQSSWQRTLAWLHRFRRLALRYERRADVHEAFLTLGCALRMVGQERIRTRHSCETMLQ
jgi:hypothetical protein